MFMLIEEFRRERMVKQALRAIARQRVALVLNPGNVVVVEKSPPDEEWFDVGVRTCHIRGWVEILHDAIPTGRLNADGTAPLLPWEIQPQTHYRLTERGWSVLNRSHGWVIATFLTSALTLVATLVPLFRDWLR